MSILHRYTKHDFDVNYAKGYWTSDHLLQVVARNAKADPERTAVVEGSYRVTRKELADLVERAARSFKAEGVQRGDIVAVQLPNSLHLVVVILALIRIGAIFHGVNQSYRYNDLSKIFGRSWPHFCVYTPRFRSFEYEPLMEALQKDAGLTFKPRVVDIDRPVEESFPEAAGDLPSLEHLDPDAMILIGATSGSTGDPKLFMHTQNTQFNEARTLIGEMGFTGEDAILAFAPITHRGVFMWGFMLAMASGAALVVRRTYDPKAILEEIDAHRVTSLFAIPTQVGDLLDQIPAGCDRGSSLRVLMMAGAPVQPELIDRIKAAWPDCAPVTGYGTSETGYSVITRPSYPLDQLRTCGRPIAGMEVRVDRDPASSDPDGELQLRGAFLSAGYFSDQKATDDAYTRDGWFRTGDLGHLDENGNVILTGRLKNVIIRSGLKIQAEELEEVLLRHPAISQAVVVGVTDTQVGERTAACIVLKQKQSLELEDVVTFLEKSGVAKFKFPERLHLYEELPATALGKYDRVELRKQLNSQHS